MKEPFQNAPDLGESFDKSRQQDVPGTGPEIDAIHWEPTEEIEELNYDPPRKVHDPERVMVPTPHGTIEQEVHQELDSSAQQAIRDAQRQERDVEHDFSDLRSIDEVPGADKEYEVHIREQDDYEARMRDRFNHVRDRDQDQGFDR